MPNRSFEIAKRYLYTVFSVSRGKTSLVCVWFYGFYIGLFKNLDIVLILAESVARVER